MPTELRDIVLDFVWNADRLRELDLPTTTVPVSELDWHLNLPFWAVDDVPFQVTPRQIATEPHRFSAQYERMLAADLQFPLDVVVRTDQIAVRALPWDRLDDIAG
ncbi:hypothetical protein BWI15_34580 [Kribbella sp. ALI-6-A]|nr:hypothetical protein BWI15_34580 [Kribbella sp. ALI-6-A]